MKLSRKHFLSLAVMFALGAIVFCIMLLCGDREPAYNGRRLGYWLDQLPATYPVPNQEAYSRVSAKGYRTTQEQEEDQKLTQEAFRAIQVLGTNCIPTLRTKLQAKDSPMARTLMPKVVGIALRIGLLNARNVPLDAEFRRRQALTALLALDTLHDISPLVPDLVRLAKDPDPQIRTTALFALKGIAPREYEKLKSEP